MYYPLNISHQFVYQAVKENVTFKNVSCHITNGCYCKLVYIEYINSYISWHFCHFLTLSDLL